MTISAILNVGPNQQFTTIVAAITAANVMGGNVDIRIAAGTYANDGGYLWDTTNNVTIEGIGGMVRLITPLSAGGKAAIAVGGDNIVLKNFDISGATNPLGTAAAIYDDRGTLTLDNVRLHNNQAGIIAGADSGGSIEIKNSEIDHNGSSAGGIGNIEIGDVARFSLITSYVHDAEAGDEIQSRAGVTFLDASVVADNSATSAYSVDLPNGGTAVISSTVIEQGPNSQNNIVVGYGEAGNLQSATSVYFDNNTVINDIASGAGLLLSGNAATVTSAGNSAYNLTNLGAGLDPATVTALSTRPNLASVEQSILSSIAANASSSQTLHPTISTIIGVPYTGVRLTGTVEAGSTVSITETIKDRISVLGDRTSVLGTTIAASNGTWSFMSYSNLGHVDLSFVHRYSAIAVNGAGDAGSAPGPLWLTDTGNDVLNATKGGAEVFAIMSNFGSDMITGFQTASAVGASHDILNFSGRGISSFNQVKTIMSGSSETVVTLAGGKTVTLAGVAPTSLTAADFRFS